MCVWDLNPGYLNNLSLSGEHCELHGIVSIISKNKKVYSQPPETLRWKSFGWALRQRHILVRAKVLFRGFKKQTPFTLRASREKWPSRYSYTPYEQYRKLGLGRKYVNKALGRIALLKNVKELREQHKYSLLACDPGRYTLIRKFVAENSNFETRSQPENVSVRHILVEIKEAARNC